MDLINELRQDKRITCKFKTGMYYGDLNVEINLSHTEETKEFAWVSRYQGGSWCGINYFDEKRLNELLEKCYDIKIEERITL